MIQKTALHIPSNRLPLLAQIKDRIQKKSDDFAVSFLFHFDDNRCEIIGGCEPNYSSASVELNSEIQTHRKLSDFSLPGDVFINWYHCAQALQSITNDPFITLPIHYNAKAMTSHIIIFDTKAVSLPLDSRTQDIHARNAAILRHACQRDITTQPALERHVQFVSNDRHRHYQEVTVATCHTLLEEAKPHIPLQMIEFDPSVNKLKIMRDNKIETITAQMPIKLDHRFVSTEEGLILLGRAIGNTADRSVALVQENDNLFIKTSEQCSLISLTMINEFRELVEATTDVIEVFTIDFVPFKTEVEALRGYDDIRAYDMAMFVLTKAQSYITSIIEEGNHIKPIQVSSLSLDANEQCVVQFHLKAFVDLKVRDITTMKQTKVSLYKDNSGEHFLGFYKDSKDKTPAQSLPIVLIDDKKNLKKIEQLIADYQENRLDDSSISAPKEQNLELDLESMF